VEVFCETSSGWDRGRSQRHKARNKSQPEVELGKLRGVGKFIVLTFNAGKSPRVKPDMLICVIVFASDHVHENTMITKYCTQKPQNEWKFCYSWDKLKTRIKNSLSAARTMIQLHKSFKLLLLWNTTPNKI
jgi:hypothetical protein